MEGNEAMKKAIIIIMIIILLACVSYGCWAIGRKINYELSYKSMVEQTIEQMVKTECLNKD